MNSAIAILLVVFLSSQLFSTSGSWNAQQLASSLLKDTIDFHVHSAPDVTDRIIDDFELAQMAAKAKMKAVVLKNHVTNTADRAVLAHKIVPDIEVFGGVVLNHSVGGINPQAVETMYRLGNGRGKVVWLPTIDADYHLKVFHKSGTGLKVARQGRLLPQTEAVLKAIAKYNLVLGTGHISPEEVHLVVQKARSLGVKKILITHGMADVPGLSISQMQEIAEMGALIELVYVNELMGENSAIAAHRNWHRVSIQKMAQAIKIIGAEHFVLSTDLGRSLDPLPIEGYQKFIQGLKLEGITQAEIDVMAKKNPAWLLGINS
jgi:hypothetical protein